MSLPVLGNVCNTRGYQKVKTTKNFCENDFVIIRISFED